MILLVLAVFYNFHCKKCLVFSKHKIIWLTKRYKGFQIQLFFLDFQRLRLFCLGDWTVYNTFLAQRLSATIESIYFADFLHRNINSLNLLTLYPTVRKRALIDKRIFPLRGTIGLISCIHKANWAVMEALCIRKLM